MVQGRTVSIISLVAYLIILVFTLIYACHFWQLKIGEWFALITLLIFAGVFMLNGLGQILKILREPRLEIKNARVKFENANSKDEIKNLFFDIQNNGNIQAKCCEIEVEGRIWDTPYKITDPNSPTVSEFDVKPNRKKTKLLGKVTKPTNCIIYALSPDAVNVRAFPTLTKGIYMLKLRFSGKNFVNKKIYRLKLDLSSWENIGITLDC